MRRFRQVDPSTARSRFADWVFLLLLWATGVTGFVIEIAIYLDIAGGALLYGFSLVHIDLALEFLLLVPLSKFTHSIYRPLALLIIATHGPEDPERATFPLIITNGALALDVEALIVLPGAAVLLAMKDQADHVLAAGLPPLGDLLRSFRDQGGELLVCTPSLTERSSGTVTATGALTFASLRMPVRGYETSRLSQPAGRGPILSETPARDPLNNFAHMTIIAPARRRPCRARQPPATSASSLPEPATSPSESLCASSRRWC